MKEAVNNVLKHSGAQELQAQIRFDEPLLTISISDDGKGGAPWQTAKGNGLINMKQRMAAIKGTVTIVSLEGKGTTVRFQMPMMASTRLRTCIFTQIPDMRFSASGG